MVSKNVKRGRKSWWTPERIALLRKHYPGKPNEEVAAILKTEVVSIRNAAVKFRVKKAAYFWDLPEEKFILANWEVMSAAEIGKKLNRTRWAIVNKYRELTGVR